MDSGHADKKVLLVCKDRAQGMTDLGGLVVTLATRMRIESKLPQDFRNYDAIIFHDLPQDLPSTSEFEEKIEENPGMPILASPRISKELGETGYDRFAAIVPHDQQLDNLRKFWNTNDQLSAVWSSLRNHKIEYWAMRNVLVPIMEEKGVPTFQAFYDCVADNAQKMPELVKMQISRFERVRIELDGHSRGYELCLGGPNEQYFKTAAERELGDYLAIANICHEQIRSLLNLQGPSVLGGSHFLFQEKELPRDRPTFNFLKEVRDKEGIPHHVIAQVIYEDAKHFNSSSKEPSLRIADSRPPLRHGERSYLPREEIKGPDLENILLVLRKRVEEGGQKKTWATHCRNICIGQVLQDIVTWQNDAKPISAQEIPRTAEKIVDHLVGNLNKAFETYSRYVGLTDDERALWDESIKLYNPKNLDINKSTIKRHFDASTSNIKLMTGDHKASFEDLEKLARGGSKSGSKKKKSSIKDAEKRILDSICYVDPGFTYVHEDEDFFHVTSSFGFHDDGKSSYQVKIDTIWERYADFNKYRKRKKAPGFAQRLHGFYRNFVSGHLGLMKYEKERKGIKGARERHAHRLGLADAFANDSIQCLRHDNLEQVEAVQDDPKALLEKIREYSRKTEPDEYNGLTTSRVFGLGYFARKYSKIKLVPA